MLHNVAEGRDLRRRCDRRAYRRSLGLPTEQPLRTRMALDPTRDRITIYQPGERVTRIEDRG